MLVVGIAGGTGSGKTTVVEKNVKRFHPGRVILRDINERGRSVIQVLERYEKTVKPMHLQFIEPTKRYADIIIPHGGNNEAGIDILTSIIEKNLGTVE